MTIADSRVHHIGINVVDLDKSAEFYERLGFSKTLEQPIHIVAQQWAATVMGVDEVELNVMFLALGGSALELIQVVTPESTLPGPVPVPTVGRAHVAIAVPDVNVAYESLRQQGTSFVAPPVTVTDGDLAGATVVYGFDPDGNIIELLSGL